MNTKRIKLLLISFIYLFALPVSAQEKIEEGEVTINNRVYSVSKNDPQYKTKAQWIRENNEFIQNQKKSQKPYVRLDRIEFATTETVISAVIKVLGRFSIEALSASNGRLIVYLYPDYTGKIKAMEFFKSIDLPITMKELDKITDYIKKNVSFKIPEHIGPDQQIPPIHQTLPIDVILKKGDEDIDQA